MQQYNKGCYCILLCYASLTITSWQYWLDSFKTYFSWNVCTEPQQHLRQCRGLERAQKWSWLSYHSTATQHVTACTKQGRANVTYKSHNKRSSYWMCCSAAFDKLRVVAAAALLRGPSRGQVQAARCHVICVHVAAPATDERCPWSWKVFALSPHKVQGVARIQQKSAWITLTRLIHLMLLLIMWHAQKNW